MTSSSGRAPRGRRDNGLDASEYAAAADVDPRVGEHLLDVLGLAGIAAYLQPSSDLHPVTRTTTLPNRPTDRLWVDRQHLEQAREVIGRVDLGTGADSPATAGPAGAAAAGEPEPSAAAAAEGRDAETAQRRRRRDDLDIEAAWQQILASWDAPTADPLPPLPRPAPTDEPAAGSREDPTAAPGETAPEPPRPRDGGEPPQDDAAGAADRADREERRRSPRHAGPAPIVGLDLPFDPQERVVDPDDEGYVPPAPPPLPRVSRYTALAVVLILAGLALFFWPSLLPITEPAALVLGMLGVVGGFGTLVWRLRDGLTSDDDPDDGAVV